MRRTVSVIPTRIQIVSIPGKNIDVSKVTEYLKRVYGTQIVIKDNRKFNNTGGR